MVGRRGRARAPRSVTAVGLLAAAALTAACAGPAGSSSASSSSSSATTATTGQATTGQATTGQAPTGQAPTASTPSTAATTPVAPTSSAPAPTPSTASGAGGRATAAPSWLGRRVLPLRKDGYGRMGPTPKELDPRDIATVDELPPPVDGRFRSTVTTVPVDVARRSTWDVGCPVSLDDLRYVTVSFVGFDDKVHTGELLVNKVAAQPMVRVFKRLFDARYPIERMVVTTAEERDAPPTGDGNTTGAFNCRSAAGTTHWSQHAYGLAVDVNPFMNPYVKGDVTLPELATTYRDRGDVRPGMITADGPVVKAFRAEGWGWGGSWKSLKDFMHFSKNGT